MCFWLCISLNSQDIFLKNIIWTWRTLRLAFYILYENKRVIEKKTKRSAQLTNISFLHYSCRKHCFVFSIIFVCCLLCRYCLILCFFWCAHCIVDLTKYCCDKKKMVVCPASSLAVCMYFLSCLNLALFLHIPFILFFKLLSLFLLCTLSLKGFFIQWEDIPLPHLLLLESSKMKKKEKVTLIIY